MILKLKNERFPPNVYFFIPTVLVCFIFIQSWKKKDVSFRFTAVLYLFWMHTYYVPAVFWALNIRECGSQWVRWNYGLVSSGRCRWGAEGGGLFCFLPQSLLIVCPDSSWLCLYRLLNEWPNAWMDGWMRVFMLVPFVEWMNEQTHTQTLPWYAFLGPTLWSTHYTEGVFLTKVCGTKPVMVGVPSECSVRVPFKEVAVRNLPFVLSVLLVFLFLMLCFCFVRYLCLTPQGKGGNFSALCIHQV